MRVRLKPVNEQVVVITGASSGIGLATARLLAQRGARLVLVARSEEALKKLAEELRAKGCEAIHVAADVSSVEEVRRASAAAIERFGGYDTWVNDAGVSIYGRLEEVPLDEQKRLFDTNYWGVVHGSLVAAEHLRRRGGAIINVGSIVSDRSIPLQGAYAASKHAVKGFTDALRMELEHEGAPVSVTLIKPASIDTPFTSHARNYMAEEPTLPPPVYAPETVARAIVRCCEHATREVTVGGGGRALTAAGSLMPRLTDRFMEAAMFRLQRSGRRSARPRRDGLFEASGEGLERGAYEGMVRERSYFTAAQLHPVVTVAAAALGAAAAGYALWEMLRPAPKPTVRRRAERAVRPVVERARRAVAGRWS